MQQATTVREALRASLTGVLGTFLSALPRIIAFVIVLVVGWLIAALITRGAVALLRAVRFNDLARRSGLAGFVQNMGVRQDAAAVIAGVAGWFVRLLTLVVAFDTLGVPAVSGVLQQLLLWLPNLAVGLVVLVIGGLAANALSRLVRGSAAGAGLSNPEVLAAATRIAVWAFAVVVAVSQLGIATTLINTLLVGVVGAVALATGLAFGLGGRDRAARLLARLDDGAVPAPTEAPAGRSALTPEAAAAPQAAAVTQGAGAPLVAVATEAAAAPEAGVAAEPTVAREAPVASEATVAPVAAAGSLRLVAFEEAWTPRSGVDRRRVARPGPDRRTGWE